MLEDLNFFLMVAFETSESRSRPGPKLFGNAGSGSGSGSLYTGNEYGSVILA